MKNRIILDICGGTGSWSAPYKEAGYDVRVIDVKQGNDIRWFYKPDEKIYGILAAPPCTHFANSGARYWKEKDKDGRTLHDIAIMDACIRIIWACNPRFYAIENPVGRMRRFLGDPTLIFNPCDYGDPYTKKTLLWGNFNIPKKNPVEPTEGSKMHLLPPSKERATLRSITPRGFADAFFNANQ